MLTFNKQETIKVKWFIDEEIISKEQKPTEGFRGGHGIWFWRFCKSFLEKYGKEAQKQLVSYVLHQGKQSLHNYN